MTEKSPVRVGGASVRTEKSRENSECRIQKIEWIVLNTEYGIHKTEFIVMNTEYGIQKTELIVLNTAYRI